MRRADIARDSAVTGGADYLFTLLDRARGRRVVVTIDFALTRAITTSAMFGLSRYGVKLSKS